MIRLQTLLQSSLLQSLLDPSLADWIFDQQLLLTQHSLQSLTDAMEAACRTILLGELRNTQIRFSTSLNNTVDVGMEIDRFDVQI